MTNYDILKEYETHKTPVPSYKEWQELSKQRNQLIRDVKDLAYIQEENQHLKAENAQLRKFLEEFNALDVAKENDKIKTENKWYSEQLNEAVKEVSQLKEVITKICTELVDDDDDMSLGLAEYFSQELLLEIREVLK